MLWSHLIFGLQIKHAYVNLLCSHLISGLHMPHAYLNLLCSHFGLIEPGVHVEHVDRLMLWSHLIFGLQIKHEYLSLLCSHLISGLHMAQLYLPCCSHRRLLLLPLSIVDWVILRLDGFIGDDLCL